MALAKQGAHARASRYSKFDAQCGGMLIVQACALAAAAHGRTAQIERWQDAPAHGLTVIVWASMENADTKVSTVPQYPSEQLLGQCASWTPKA